MRHLACFLTLVMLLFYSCELHNLAGEQSTEISTSTVLSELSSSDTTEPIELNMPGHVQELINEMIKTSEFIEFHEQWVDHVIGRIVTPEFRSIHEAEAYFESFAFESMQALENNDREAFAVILGYNDLKEYEGKESLVDQKLEKLISVFPDYGELTHYDQFLVLINLIRITAEWNLYPLCDADCYFLFDDCKWEAERKALRDAQICFEQADNDPLWIIACKQSVVRKFRDELERCYSVKHICETVCDFIDYIPEGS